MAAAWDATHGKGKPLRIASAPGKVGLSGLDELIPK